MSTVLVVQYHSEIRSLLILLLRQRGYNVEIAGDISEIRKQALQHEIGLVCLDIMLPGLDQDNPVEIFRSGDMGPSLAEVPILITDVNGLLESSSADNSLGADGLYAPRTDRSDSFLHEVEKLMQPPMQPIPMTHSWRLDKNELPAFLYACFLFGINGYLTLHDGRTHKSLHFHNGWIRSASSSVESDWLGKMLLSRHMINAESLNEVERALAKSGRMIGEEFIARGYLDEKQIHEALNQQYATIAMSVFEWEHAEVSINEGDPNPAPHLMMHPFRMVLSGLNLGFSESEIDRLLPRTDYYLTPTVWTSFRFSDVDLNEQEKQLILTIDGQRKIEALINSSPFPPLATKKFLLTLLTMRLVVASDQPESLPITFSRQIESDTQTIIEDQFYEDGRRVITFDDLNVENDDEEFNPDQPITWRERFAVLEYLAAARYLVAAGLTLIAFTVLFLLYVRRDIAMQWEKYERNLEAERTEIVLIKKPRFEKAENLLVEAQLILRERKWHGLAEARSLIGGALDIDPEFSEAINFRTSIDLTCQARDEMQRAQYDVAEDLLDQAVKLFPENPLATTLMKKLKPVIGGKAAQAP